MQKAQHSNKKCRKNVSRRRPEGYKSKTFPTEFVEKLRPEDVQRTEKHDLSNESLQNMCEEDVQKAEKARTKIVEKWSPEDAQKHETARPSNESCRTIVFRRCPKD